MKIGVLIPHIGPHVTREFIKGFGVIAEEAGIDSIFVFDHVVYPRQYSSRYPYNPSGEMGITPDTPFYEPLTVLTFLAGVTERVMLGTGVLVTPMRNPVLHAKMMATLDQLSGGRFIYGAGVGWFKEEFEALAAPWEQRGRRTDDYLALTKKLWTEEHTAFESRSYSIPDLGFAPKPAQRPHPPIWVGGHTPPALRRAGRYGDAWFAPGNVGGRLQEMYATVKEEARAADRNPDDIALTMVGPIDTRPENREQAVERARGYRESGVSHIVTQLFARDLESTRTALTTIAREIRPRVLEA